LKVDSFIIFSNIVAITITGLQLMLFIIYPHDLPYNQLSPSNKKSYVSRTPSIPISCCRSCVLRQRAIACVKVRKMTIIIMFIQTR
jgi:hypothetical protein